MDDLTDQEDYDKEDDEPIVQNKDQKSNKKGN